MSILTKKELEKTETLQEILNIIGIYIKNNYQESINTTFKNLEFNNYILNTPLLKDLMVLFNLENIIPSIRYYITSLKNKELYLQMHINRLNQGIPKNKEKLLKYLKLEYKTKSEEELDQYQDKLLNGDEKFEFDNMSITEYLNKNKLSEECNLKIVGEYNQFLQIDINTQFKNNIIEIVYTINENKDLFKYNNIQLEILSNIIKLDKLMNINFEDIKEYININSEEKIISDINKNISSIISKLNNENISFDNFINSFNYLNSIEIQFNKNSLNIEPSKIINEDFQNILNKIYYLY